jgi:adenylate cyclase
VNRKLSRALHRLGATDAEIAEAERHGWLTLLTVDKLLLPGSRRYDIEDMSARVGVDRETSDRLWRALGFPDLPPDAAIFTDTDVDALEELQARPAIASSGERSVAGVDDVVEQVRTFSAGLARVAAALTDQLAYAIRRARDAGLSDEETAGLVLDELDWPSLSRLFDYVLRLQSRDMLRRKLANEDPDDAGARVLAVGFVDLVGYTALSQLMSPDELSALVRRFEALAFDTVAQESGRIVKTIGDEVMYVAGDVADAARIARRLTDRSADDELLPQARAGLASGSVVTRQGDYFGPVVNLASRLVEIARPGTVIVSDEVHEALSDDPSFSWKRLRPRRLRDIGRVDMWGLAAVEAAEVPAPDSTGPDSTDPDGAGPDLADPDGTAAASPTPGEGEADR